MKFMAPLMGLLAFALSVPAVCATPKVDLAKQTPLIQCGDWFGTGIDVGPYVLTAKHVIGKATTCEVNGTDSKVIYTDPKEDFAILQNPNQAGTPFTVSCDGFQKDHAYLLIGHARGMPDLSAVPLVDTGDRDDEHLEILAGEFTAQPGHSGGPIVDADTGAVVGITIAADWEGGGTDSLPLADTPVCKVH